MLMPNAIFNFINECFNYIPFCSIASKAKYLSKMK